MDSKATPSPSLCQVQRPGLVLSRSVHPSNHHFPCQQAHHRPGPGNSLHQSSRRTGFKSTTPPTTDLKFDIYNKTPILTDKTIGVSQKMALCKKGLVLVALALVVGLCSDLSFVSGFPASAAHEPTPVFFLMN
ncbi:hypothetical protein FF2_003308 [Malus domestica]